MSIDISGQRNVFGRSSGHSTSLSGTNSSETEQSSGESRMSPPSKRLRETVMSTSGELSPLPSAPATPASAPYSLHLKCDEKAVNMGICFWNAEKDTYYVKARKACPFDQLPKEVIHMCLERRPRAPKYKSVEFYITGNVSQGVLSL